MIACHGVWFFLCFLSGALGETDTLFQDNHLIQVGYNTRWYELATDLGDLSTIDLNARNVVLSPPGTVDLKYFPNISGWAELRMGFFSQDYSRYQFWFATTEKQTPGIKKDFLQNFVNGTKAIQMTYQSAKRTGPRTVKIYAGDPAKPGYDLKLNRNKNRPGAYGSFNATPVVGEASLAALETAGYVDMYLYHYEALTLQKDQNQGRDFAAVLRLYSNGATVLNPDDVSKPPEEKSFFHKSKAETIQSGKN